LKRLLLHAYTRYARLGASSRLRLYQYLPRLASLGIDVEVFPLFSDDYVLNLQQGKSRSIMALAEAYVNRWHHRVGDSPGLRVLGSTHGAPQRRPDLIWVEKEVFPWLGLFAERLFLSKDIPVILDYDDAIFHQYDAHRLGLIRILLGKKLAGLMRRASAVVAGNRYLAEYAHQAGAKRVMWLPTVVDISRYALRSSHQMTHNPPDHPQVDLGGALRPSQRVPRIGWIGQRSTAHFLRPLAPVLTELKSSGIAESCAIGIDAAALELPMASMPWSEASEISSLQTLDVGVMPLTDGLFERGKCGYKLIQYMACGLPVVASPVGVNNELIKHGVNGFLADSLEDWMQALKTLCNDRALRERMGAAGRRLVEDRYSLEGCAPKFADLCWDLAKRS